jgi:Leucine-rich repeat (LRR) protein
MNLECLYASHNLIKDIYGVCQLTTLRELNLSFNMIKDISPIEQLTLLEKLFLNRNQISVIDPIKKLTSLQEVGLFHNEVFNQQKSLEVFAYLGINYKLRVIAIDGNPISSTIKFKYQLIVAVPKLEILDDEPIQQLDRDVADQYFEVNNITKP